MKWISKSLLKIGHLPQFLDKVCHSERAERVEESSNTILQDCGIGTFPDGYFPINTSLNLLPNYL